MEKELLIKVPKGAPYLVFGTVKLVMPDGEEKIVENPHLCRCGASQNKPFCDGSHAKIGFEK